MFFVIEAPALGAGRTIGLVVTSILTAMYCVITLLEVQSYCRRALDSEKPGRLEILPKHLRPGNPVSISLSPQSPSTANITSLQDSHHAASIPRSTYPPQFFHKRRPKRRRWSFDLDPMLVGIVICQAMVFTYFIVSSELLLKNNPSIDHSAAQWGFGQILALIVVLPSALALIGAVMRHGVSKRNKKLFPKQRDTKQRHRSSQESV